MPRILPEKVVELWTARAVERAFPEAFIWSPTGSGPARWDQAVGARGNKAWLFELKAPEQGGARQGPAVEIDRRQLWDYLDRVPWSARWASHLGDGGTLRWSIGFLGEPRPKGNLRAEYERRAKLRCTETGYRHPSPSYECWAVHCRDAWEVVRDNDAQFHQGLLDELWAAEDLIEVVYLIPTPPWGHVPADPLPAEAGFAVRDAFGTFSWAINARDLATSIGLTWGPYSSRPTGKRTRLACHQVSGLQGAFSLNAFLASVEDCTSSRRFGIDARFEQTGIIEPQALPVQSALFVTVPLPARP